MRLFALMAASLTFAGCFTLHETEYPAVQLSQAGDREVNVQLAGFETTVTTYATVYGYETVYHHGYGYRHHPGYWFPTTVTTETYVPQTSMTTAYLDRATSELEQAGFNLKTDKPKYRVEVKFGGPIVTDGDVAVEMAWVLLSALSADYGVQKWTAAMSIYDVATGKLLMHADYEQRYQTVVWGPLPIFSPCSSEKTSFNSMQSWCLSALTDRTMADATAFLLSDSAR